MTQEKIVKVIETTEQKILYSYTIDDLQIAYDKASELEEMGLDIEVQAPSAPETLAIALGSDNEKLQKLKSTIDHEISEHDLEACMGCGFKSSKIKLKDSE